MKRAWALAAVLAAGLALARAVAPRRDARPLDSAPVEDLRDAVADVLAPRTSTASARSPLPGLVPPPGSEAVKAGERRGMVELMSAAAAPADRQ